MVSAVRKVGGGLAPAQLPALVERGGAQSGAVFMDHSNSAGNDGSSNSRDRSSVSFGACSLFCRRSSSASRGGGDSRGRGDRDRDRDSGSARIAGQQTLLLRQTRHQKVALRLQLHHRQARPVQLVLQSQQSLAGRRRRHLLH